MLPRGEITDGLSGLRALPDAELPALAQRIAEELAAVLPGLIERKFRELRQSAAGESAALRHVNTKFSLDGAFVGRFATLDDFHRGPEEHIGVPNPRIEEGVEAEHCRRSNRDVKFTTSNYNIVTWPSLEYEFVMAPKAGADYPHTPRDSRLWKNGIYSETNKQGWKGEHGRDPIALDAFLPDHPEAAALLAALPAGVQDFVLAARGVIKKAGLLRVEVACLRLYTGPLFTLYNAVLRGFPAGDVAALLDNRYETSIFTITSGITKVSKISDVPPNRLLFRGCGGMILPRQFWDRYDECTVAVVILAHDKEAAVSAVEAVECLLEKRSNAAPRASPAYDLDVQYLRLPAPIDDDALRAAADTGIRVASAPRQQESPASAALALAVPLEKLAFEARLSKALKAALSVACGGRAVVFERVAAKPQGFCGGGACHCAPRSAAPDMRKRRFPCAAPAPFPFSHAALPLHFPFPMRCSRSLSLFPCAAPAPFSFSHAPLPSPPPHPPFPNASRGASGSRIRPHVDHDGPGNGRSVQRRGQPARHGARDRGGRGGQGRLHQLPLRVPRGGRVPHAAPLLPRGPPRFNPSPHTRAGIAPGLTGLHAARGMRGRLTRGCARAARRAQVTGEQRVESTPKGQVRPPPLGCAADSLMTSLHQSASMTSTAHHSGQSRPTTVVTAPMVQHRSRRMSAR
jgi:hypothetical protein